MTFDEIIRFRSYKKIVAKGFGRGPALVSRRAFMFAHGVEPHSGEVIDIQSDILGQSIKGKVLVFPFGKGSTTGSAWFLESLRNGNGPVAVINQETEPIIATVLVIGKLLYGVEIPLLDRLEHHFVEQVADGALLKVDGVAGEVRVLG